MSPVIRRRIEGRAGHGLEAPVPAEKLCCFVAVDHSHGATPSDCRLQRRRRGCGLERDDFSSNRHLALSYAWSMIFSENRYPLFGIMLWARATLTALGSAVGVR